MFTGPSRRRRLRPRRPLSWSLALLTVVATLHAGADPAAAAERPKPAVPADKPAPHGKPLNPRTARKNAMAPAAPPRVSASKAGSAEVAVGATARFGGLGVSLRNTATGADRPQRAWVQVLDPATAPTTAVGGTLLRLRRADAASSTGRNKVSLDYAGLADAYGGDYGARLRLYRVPECAGCTPVEVPAVNDVRARTVTADVDLAASSSAGVLYALAADQVSAQGDYSATKTAPSSKWSVSASSGALNWSYPMRVPPVPGGLAPQVTMAYSSQAVDGRTSATNNQGSWIGEGFSYEPGYIERRYKSCQDDGHDTVADQCWARDNASIVLAGTSGELIQTGTDEWRLPQDDGTRVKRLTGATNGDNNGEYWQVTAPDGIQYFFGYNRLPGWTANKEETNSTWTVPVYGDDKDEPCYNATFANAWCQQAWRWNLDYVKDPGNNVIAYYYDKEKNSYARGAKTDVNGTGYDRGGYLKRIDYGQRHNAVYTSNAPARVEFAIDERCIATDTVKCGVGDLKDSTAANWPDVPWDQNCAADTKCKITQASPTFWTRKRATGVTTEIRTATGWSAVDTWSLTQIFTDNGDGSRSLWLRNIDHEGRVGGSAKIPSVDLAGIQLANRIVKPGDNIGGLIRFRLATVWTDAGGQLDVTYKPADCSASDLPKEGESTRRCFPVKWHPNTSDKEPVTDWFHKYVVSDVVETDLISGAPDMVTHYDYVGDAGWRKNEPDGIADDKYLTYSDWRGYGEVHETRGDGQTMPERTDTRYLRGLGGTVDDSTGASHADYDQYAGLELEKTTYDDDHVVSKTITDPWRATTYTQTEKWGTRTSTIVRPASTRSLTALSSGGWRETRQDTTYDTVYGRVAQVDDLGDVDVASDDKCTRTWYTVDGSGPQSLTARVETVAARCSATPDRRTQVISDVRTYYDNLGWGVAATKGRVTRTEKLKSHDGTTATYVTETTKSYDDWGREKTSTDVAGNLTGTSYVDTNGLQTSSTTKNALLQEETTEYAPAWGSPTARIDANGHRQDLQYDPLGRLVNVWLADRSRVAGNTPSLKYTYLHRKDLGVAVETETVQIDGSYRAQYDLYDGHLRTRQSQVPGPDGGRLIVDTLYDGTGKTRQTNESYYAAGVPADRIRAFDNGDVEAQTIHQFDGAGRETAEIFAVSGTEKWRTTTKYGGDRVTVDPPTGGTATITLLDAHENPVELRQYHGDAPGGDYDTTKYAYTADGLVSTITRPGGRVWTTTYDQRRRKATTSDPDSGTVTYGYDDLDRVTTTKDAEGSLVTTVYDELSRRTATWQGAADTGTKLSTWAYDTVDKGQLYSAARYTNGKAYGVVYPTRDEFYRPLRTRYVIPDDAGEQLKGTYEFTTAYNRDGTVSGIGLPAAGGLTAEGIAYSYDGLGRTTAMGGNQTYVTRADYTHTGLLLQTELSSGAKKAWLTWDYEEGTNRLSRAIVDRQGAGVSDVDARYTYDASGNIRSIVDAPVGGQRDVQCFDVDYLRRMTEAWTSASTAADPCAGGADATGVGGPAAYHHSYSYDDAGNRTGETVHGVDGTPDTTLTYAYPAAGAAQPETLRSVTGDGNTDTYQYDKDGRTTARSVDGRSQSLKWDAEGHLQSVTEAGQTTSYVYGPDGERLARKDPNATTVYLPGMELRLNTATKVVEGTRYYVFGGRTVAMRTSATLSFLAADHQDTDDVVIDAVTGAITRRRTAPFGEVRGGAPSSWPSDRGFVGGTSDPTGTVHLGAREYDPGTGRFLSDDPLVDRSDPQQMNGYAYSNNNPVTLSDPTGKMPARDPGQSTRDSPHNLALAAMFAMAMIYLKIVRRLKGELTADIGPGGRRRNTIPGARQDKPGDGVADLIFWSQEKTPDGKLIVQVWEVKPGNGYGRVDGPKDLRNYIDNLQKQLGQGYSVQPGQWLPPVGGIPTGNGRYIKAWTEGNNPGLIFYGEDTPPKVPEPEPRTQPEPQPGRQPVPVPTGVEAPRTAPVPNAPPGTGVQPIPHPNGPYGTCPGPGCASGGDPVDGPLHWDPHVPSARAVGTGVLTGIAIVGCLLVCWLSPATA